MLDPRNQHQKRATPIICKTCDDGVAMMGRRLERRAVSEGVWTPRIFCLATSRFCLNNFIDCVERVLNRCSSTETVFAECRLGDPVALDSILVIAS